MLSSSVNHSAFAGLFGLSIFESRLGFPADFGDPATIERGLMTVAQLRPVHEKFPIGDQIAITGFISNLHNCDFLPAGIELPPVRYVHRHDRFEQSAMVRIAQVEKLVSNHKVSEVLLTFEEVNGQCDDAARRA